MNPCTLIKSTNIRERILHMASISERDGLERGILIFEKGGELHMTKIHKGGERDITVSLPSMFGLGIIHTGKMVGMVHTHPNEKFESLFSPTDIENMFANDLKFSASVFDEEGDVIVEVFDRQGINSVDGLVNDPWGSVDDLRKANEELLECVVNLGDIDGR